MLSFAAMRRGVWSALSGTARLVAWCSLALLVPLLVPLATGRVFTKDDLGALHLPFRYLYQQSLQSGEFLLWTPAYHSGFFLFGAGEAGMAHPLHLALYGLLPLGPAFNLEIFSNYVLLFVGTGLFWRRVGISQEGALLGAMIFAFSGFNLFNLMHVNHIGTFAHAPWLLLATHYALTATVRRQWALAFGAMAFVLGLQLLAGNPQYVWLTGIAVAYLIGCLVIAGAPWWRVGLALGALALGALIGAIQLIPTWEFLQDSTRADWSSALALTFSLSPLNLIQLWAPFAFEFRIAAPPSEAFMVHEFVVYNGAFCTMAIAWAGMRFRELSRRTVMGALLVFAAINLWLALGRYGGLYPLLAELPGLRSLRAPARHLVLVQLALSGVAALVFDDLLSLAKARHRLAWTQLWPLATIVGLSVVTSVAGAVLSGSSWAADRDLRLSSLSRSAPWAMMVVAIVLLVMLAARGVRGALPAAVVLAALDLGMWGYTYAFRWGPIQTIAELQASATAPAEAKPGDLIPTFAGGRDSYAILRDLRLTTGYTGLYSQRRLDPNTAAVQRIAGMAWTGDGNQWQPAANAMPRVRLVAEAETSANISNDLDRIDPLRTALVDDTLTLSGKAGSTRLLLDKPGRFEIETDADGDQLLVVTERFHRGWSAWVDGHETPTRRVYGDFLGTVVPAGRHDVDLIFRPASFWTGLLMSVAALAAALGGSYWLSRKRNEPPAGTTRRPHA